MAATAFDRPGLDMRDPVKKCKQLIWKRTSLCLCLPNGVRAIGSGAPLEQTIALDEAVGDELLVFQLDIAILDQLHDGLVVHQDVAGRSWTFCRKCKQYETN